ILKEAVASKAGLKIWDSLRVQEDEHAQLFGFRPHRMKPLRRQLLAADAAADRNAAQTQRLDAVDELLHRKVRMLQGHSGECDEALWVGCAELRERFVLDLDDWCRKVAFYLVPEGVDAERLDIDTLRIHRRDAVLCPGEQQPLWAGKRRRRQRRRLGDWAMG